MHKSTKIMLYVSTTVEIDLQDAFDDLLGNEKCKFIDENIGNASDRMLLAELRSRGFKDDPERDGAVNYAQRTFFAGGMTAHDFLADCLGLQHTASVDEIINNLKSILQ